MHIDTTVGINCPPDIKESPMQLLLNHAQKYYLIFLCCDRTPGNSTWRQKGLPGLPLLSHSGSRVMNVASVPYLLYPCPLL